MKKFVLLVGMASMMGLVSCGKTNNVQKEVAVFGPKADHGWTGAVLSDIQAKAEELNKAQTKYKYVVYSDADAEAQAKDVEDVLARKNDIAGIVIQPSSNEAESTVTKIANSKIPFVQFDRIITNDAIKNTNTNVANVKGDNHSTGVASAERFVSKGLVKTDKILIMPGDNSSVPGERTAGFKETLKAKGWSDAELNSNTLSTDYTGWSRDTSVTLFETFVSQKTVEELTEFKWFYTHDSEITMGILQALTGANITADKKKVIADNVKGLVGCGGLEEVYQVIRGDHPRSQQFNAALPHADIVDVTYDPAMMAIAMQDMADYLGGKSVTKDHVIASVAVTKENVAQFKGFGGKVNA